jgi:oligoribonuclease NrnB/cAMP/cGMP phosphodiesterase (DHH superfamily)
MKFYDVFNGDADGLCALHQLRLAEPRDAVLVTGTKRDIELLARVDAGRGDEITVFDISLEVNRESLMQVLDTGARVRWFDHHFAGTIPQRPGFRAHIDGSADTCTSLIVDRFLNGKYRAWAVVAAEDMTAVVVVVETTTTTIDQATTKMAADRAVSSMPMTTIGTYLQPLHPQL